MGAQAGGDLPFVRRQRRRPSGAPRCVPNADKLRSGLSKSANLRRYRHSAISLPGTECVLSQKVVHYVAANGHACNVFPVESERDIVGILEVESAQ